MDAYFAGMARQQNLEGVEATGETAQVVQFADLRRVALAGHGRHEVTQRPRLAVEFEQHELSLPLFECGHFFASFAEPEQKQFKGLAPFLNIGAVGQPFEELKSGDGVLLLLHGLDDGGGHILEGHFALVGDDEDREAVRLLYGTDDFAGFGSEYLAAQNVVFEIETALPAEVAALLGGVAIVGEFARHGGKAVGAAQPGEHVVNGGWPAGENAAQAALLADAVLLKVLAGLVAAYVLGDGNHAAAVHFVEDEFLFSLRDLAFDLEVVFQAILAGR